MRVRCERLDVRFLGVLKHCMYIRIHLYAEDQINDYDAMSAFNDVGKNSVVWVSS